MGISSLETDKVFLMRDATGIRPVTVEGFKNPWERACRTLCPPRPWPRFHDLRHTWPTNARRSGKDGSIAESVLGHAIRGLGVDERYSYVSDKEILRAVDSMTFDHGKTQVLPAHG
jgi:integrase